MFFVSKETKTPPPPSLSLGKSKRVCGYEIKQLPFGAYLKAIEMIENFPAELAEACFPGKSLDEALKGLSEIDKGGLQEIVSGLFTVAPRHMLALISEFSGIDEKELENNPDIGLVGIIEITEALFEVNRLGECTASLARWIEKLMAWIRGTGYKAL